MLHQIKAQQFYTDLGLLSTVLSLQKIVEFMEFSRIMSDFSVLFKADLIFKEFLRKPSKFNYFSSLCEPCKIENIYLLYPSFLPFVLGAQIEMVLLSTNNIEFGGERR